MNQYADYVHVFIKPVINFVYCTPAREGESGLYILIFLCSYLAPSYPSFSFEMMQYIFLD